MSDDVNTRSNYEFGDFKLDLNDAQLFHSHESLNLTPKAFSVLTQLIQANGSLVRKDTLFDRVWAGTIVSESALTVCIGEIRKVLGDCPKNPKFIETVHKRGYRFVAAINKTNECNTDVADPGDPGDLGNHQEKYFIDRKKEFEHLDQALTLAKQGLRQIVFISGEAGIGKTSFIDACQSKLKQSTDAKAMHGQCVIHHGRVEPYLPWLDAMTSLCNQDKTALETFKRFAPMWLLHTPSLLTQTERSELEITLAGTNGERMLREMINVLNELSSNQLLIIYLDDLHFSDLASLELLSNIAHRREKAKLLIVATYRPIDKFTSPAVLEIKQELMVRNLCSEISLNPFSLTNINDYINICFPDNKLDKGLAAAIYDCTNGNPLFVMNIIQHLIKQKQLQIIDGYWMINCDMQQVVRCIPDNLFQLIGNHIDKLAPQMREILEVAAVTCDANTKDGQFSVAEIAYALERDPVQIEAQCDELVKERHLLNSVQPGKWPDGTLLIRYSFNHSLYKRALYQNLNSGRRCVLHHRLGQRLERAYRGYETQISLKLAIHFEQGRNYELATRYLKKSAETAFQRGLNNVAIKSLQQALELSMLIADESKRQFLEMEIYTSMGTVLIADKGNDSPEVEKYFTLARELADRLEDKTKLFPIIFGLRSCCLFSSRLKQAHLLSKELFDLAKDINDDDLIVEAYVALCSTAHFLGDFEQTLSFANSAIKIYSPERHDIHIINYGLDPGVYCRGRAAQAVLCMGYPDQALSWSKQCLEMAQNINNPYTLAFALNKRAWIYLLRKQEKAADKWAVQAIDISQKHGYTFFVTWAKVIQGWSLVAQGQHVAGLNQLDDCLDTQNLMADGVRSYLLTVFADACLIAGEYKKGIKVLNQINEGAENFSQAERYYLRAKLLLNMTSHRDSEYSKDISIAGAYLKKSIECAKNQHAKWYEIQASASLAELMLSTNQFEKAYHLIEPVCEWFREGEKTVVVKKALNLQDEIKQLLSTNVA